MKRAYDVLYDAEKRKKYDSKNQDFKRTVMSRKRQKANVMSKAYAKNWPHRPTKTSKSALNELLQQYCLVLNRQDFEEKGGPPWTISWRDFSQYLDKKLVNVIDSCM